MDCTPLRNAQCSFDAELWFAVYVEVPGILLVMVVAGVLVWIYRRFYDK